MPDRDGSEGPTAPPDPDTLELRRQRAAVRRALFDATDDPPLIGRYVVERRLGAGGMGVVWLAEDRELSRKVAIKLLLRQATDSDGAQRMRREARMLARLAHPNVVHLYEVGEHEGAVFVVMEYAPGVTLRTWIAARPRAWQDVLAQLIQAGEGLVAAHAQGIVHRDFKPDNVIVSDDGRSRILDFGLARIVGALGPEATAREPNPSPLDSTLTDSGFVLGTPAYMAPEQHAAGELDARTDQFAFCVCAWECLVGRRPFSGKTRVELATAARKGAIESPPPSVNVPAAVLATLRRGLSPAPSDRFASMQELLAELRRPARTPRSIVVLAAIGAVAVAAAVVWAFAGRDRDAAVGSFAPPWTLAVDRLTHGTQRLGPCELDPFAARLACVEAGAWWIRPALGGVPEPLDFGLPTVPLSIAFTETGWRGYADAKVWQRVGKAAPQAVVSDLHGIVDLHVSRDGTRLAALEDDVVWLHVGEKPKRIQMPGSIQGFAWAPDGRFAVRVWRPGDDAEKFLVFDANGRELSRSSRTGSAHAGLTWLAAGTLLVASGSEAGLVLVCADVDGDAEITWGAESEPLPVEFWVTNVLGLVAPTTVVVESATPLRGVATLDLDAAPPRELVPRGPTYTAESSDAAWLPDGRLAFVSTRFVEPRAFAYDPERGTEDPLAEIHPGVRVLSVAGDGRLLVAGSEPAAPLTIVDPGATPRAVPGSEAWAASLAELRCVSTRCVAKLERGDREQFMSLDLDSGELAPLFVCPEDAVCRSFSLSPDGTELLLPNVRRTALVRRRVDDGAAIETLPPIDEGRIVQSGAWGPRGYLATTMSVSASVAGGGYEIAELGPDHSWRTLWRGDTWTIGPTVAPDQHLVAVETQSIDVQLYAVRSSLPCAPP